MQPSMEFWRGKRVLLTGHTGFKGSWLALWLHRLGAKVTGIALPPNTAPSLFELARISERIESRFCDIRDAARLAGLAREAAPEVVLHLAAQPLVRAGYRQPLETFSTNVMGTANLLDALRDLGTVRTVIVITTDKVYRNQDGQHHYREEDVLGGSDPYSASKAAAELVAACYRDAYLAAAGIAVCTARAGNVIGGGDWSEDRLIPDAVRAWGSGRILPIRRPNAIRPWQHVLEPLAGYLILAEQLWAKHDLAGAWNFGPDPRETATVRQVVELAHAAYGGGEVAYGDGSDGPHETGWLGLEIGKAGTQLGFAPKWPLAEAVGRTMNWYREEANGIGAGSLCEADIAAYERTA